MILNNSEMVDGDPDDGSSSDSDNSDELMSGDESFVDNGSDSSLFSDDSGGSSNEDQSNNHELDGEEEDVLVTAITSRQELAPQKPTSIKSDNDIFSGLSFHPSSNLIALSCVSGNIEMYSYSVEENVCKGIIEAHLKTCRNVEFSADGKTLYSIGRDKNVVFSDVEKLDMTMFIEGAHHVGLTALSVPGENVLATGDEEGVVKVWDARYTQTAAYKVHDAQEYISSITSKDSYKIACTSGDGTIISYDIRSNRKLQESAPFETDLTSCASTHNESMIVCGTMAGKFLFYKWNDFTEIAGTFKPIRMKKCPINTVLQISDNIIIAGMEDGQIRAYHFFPHKEIGVVGQHSLNIEGLDVSHEGNLIASLSYGEIVKFWDVSYLEGFLATEVEKNKTHQSVNLPSSEFDDRKSFFSDLS